MKIQSIQPLLSLRITHLMGVEDLTVILDRIYVRETFVQGFEADPQTGDRLQWDADGNALPMTTWYRATDQIGWSDDDGWESQAARAPPSQSATAAPGSMKKTLLPKGVHAKHGAYYLVRQVDKKRTWLRLSTVRDGLPAMYRALADAEMQGAVDERMGALCSLWLQEVSMRHAKKTQANDIYQVRTISQAFVEFRASEVRAPDAMEFLKAFQDKPRTYNAYRSMLRELMRFAEEKGLREPGTNPVDALRTAAVKARSRYITDGRSLHAIADRRLRAPQAGNPLASDAVKRPKTCLRHFHKCLIFISAPNGQT